MLHNYMFRPCIRPSSGCIRLALRIMYPDDKVYYYYIKVTYFVIRVHYYSQG